MNEPEWFRESRESSYKSYLELPMREYNDSPTQTAYTDINFDKIKEIGQAYFDIENIGYFEEKGIKFLVNNDAIEDKNFKKLFMNIINKDTKLNSLHASYVNNILLIKVPDNLKLENPIVLDVKNKKNGSMFNHVVLVVGKNSDLELYEKYSLNDTGNVFCSDFLEAYAGENSKVNIYCLQDYNKEVLNHSVKVAKVEKNAKVTWVVANLGGHNVMSMVDSILDGENAISNNFGVFLASNNHVDIIANVNHKVRNTRGITLTKGAVFERGVSVYRGEINAENEARNIVSSLAGHTLVFDNGKANAVPSLKIKTNDVNVRHAASVSQVNDDQLFYIMSRGLTKKEAVKEITLGHYSNILDNIYSKAIKEGILDLISRRLP